MRCSPALAVALVCAASAMACAQKKTIAAISSAQESALRLERRAAAAYLKGDATGAYKDYQTAAAVYSSLALQDSLAVTELNLAKLEGESGRAKEGLARAKSAIRLGQVGATQLMGHGRAAALSLALDKISEAKQHLDAADSLCQETCEAASALASLRSEALLQGGDAVSARIAGAVALQSASNQSDKANALRRLAYVGLIDGASGYATAIMRAQEALAIDQALGLSGRVIADLGLLAALNRKSGNAAIADDYARLALAARSAREQLRLK